MRYKSYISNHDKPFPNGTLISDGCLDDQLDALIPICNNGFHDVPLIGLAKLKKDDTGYYVEGEMDEKIIKSKRYASMFGRQYPDKSIEVLEVSLFDDSYRSSLDHGFEIEKMVEG